MPSWFDISLIYNDIHANRREKMRTEEEIEFLQNKLKTNEQEYNYLTLQKERLGKELYGDPKVRMALIETGLKSRNAQVRMAAQKLRQEDTNVKWDEEVKDELIQFCVSIDLSIHPIRNQNIIRILYNIGKFGYKDIRNSEKNI